MSAANIFNFIFYSSLKCSVIVLCIILLKHIIKDKFSVKWHYYIWFILIIRLIMPYAPNSPLSFFNLTKIMEADVNSKSSYISDEENAIELVDMLQYDDFSEEENIQKSGVYSINIWTITTAIWLIGIATVLGVTVIANIKFRKKWKKDAICANSYEHRVLSKCKAKMKISKDIPIFYTKNINVPVLYGLVSPCLLLPYELKDTISINDLTCIMLHELAHMKRKDIAIFWVMEILRAVYWFNPIIWYGLNKMRQDCEVACDALALSYMDSDDNIKYGYTIINMLERAKPLKFHKVVSTANMADNKRQIIRRLEMISKFKKNSYKLSITSVCILLIIGYGFITNAEDNKDILEVDNGTLELELQENKDIENSSEESNQTMTWPVTDYYRISSPYGERINPISKEKTFHSGIDILAPEGSNIVSAYDGIVIFAEYYNDYGNTVKIQHNNGMITLYAHCSELLVNEGDKVKAGDLIAKVGSTGKATGEHLHFEIQKAGEPVDPMKLFYDIK